MVTAEALPRLDLVPVMVIAVREIKTLIWVLAKSLEDVTVVCERELVVPVVPLLGREVIVALPDLHAGATGRVFISTA